VIRSKVYRETPNIMWPSSYLSVDYIPVGCPMAPVLCQGGGANYARWEAVLCSIL
jgi:hypothetical protein